MYKRNPNPETLALFDERCNQLYKELKPLSDANVFKSLLVIEEEIDKVFEKSHLTYDYDANSGDWIVYDRKIDDLVVEINNYFKDSKNEKT